MNQRIATLEESRGLPVIGRVAIVALGATAIK
jgi:hypothetical protein